MQYKTVIVTKGPRGWGGPLTITPTDEKKYIVSMCGGGIHPIAQKIADLSGAIAVDAFNNPVKNEEVACAVIDCGGTLRCGIYPKAGIPSININGGGPSGPLAKYCKEEIFCSDGKVENVILLGSDQILEAPETAEAEPAKTKEKAETAMKTTEPTSKKPTGFIDKMTSVAVGFGRVMGKIVNTIYGAARESFSLILTNVIPFMLFISLVSGIIIKTGFGNAFANILGVFTGSVGGLIVMAIICGLPVLSPLLGPGAVIESIVGVFIGNQIAMGIVPVSVAIPAYFAMSVVCGADFIAVGLSLSETDPDTIRLSIPSCLLSRFVTAPIGVLIGWVASIGLWG